MGVPGPQQLPCHQGPAQMEVGVVLPCEADAAEDLDAVLGAAVRGVERGARSEGGDQCAYLRGLVGRAGGIPYERAGLLDAHEHVGAEMLDALELADGATELFPDLGVRDGGVQRPGGGAAGFGGEQGGGEIAYGPGIGADGPAGGDVDAVGPDLGGGAGGVGAGMRAHGQPFGGGVDGEPEDAGGRIRGEQEQVGFGGGEHGRGDAVEAVAALALHGGEAAGAEGDGTDAGTGREGAHESAHLCRAGRRRTEHRRGEHGRQVGAGERGPSRLLQDDGEVEERAAPSPVLLGQMEGEQALFREPVPAAGAQAGGARVEESADLLGRYGARQPPPYGLRQLPLFSGDCDAHCGSSPVAATGTAQE